MNQIHFEVDNHGAELKSLRYVDREYLWQGDPEFWGRRAPVLFPIVGRLVEDTLRIDGHNFKMKQHGFARDSEFVRSDGQQSLLKEAYRHIPEQNGIIRFSMVQGDYQNIYPYLFDLSVSYIPWDNTLVCSWQVTNHSNNSMYFQIGTHPAFMLPDYKEADEIHGFIQCYDVDGKVVSPIVCNYLEDGLRYTYGTPKTIVNELALLALTDKTFTDGAILLEGKQVASVALFDKQGRRILTVSSPQAESFGLWAPSKPNCPFVCIEPWCGIADRHGFKGDFSERECNHCLAPDKVFFFNYSIQIH